MQVSRIRALRGPNLWTRHTAIEAIVTCLPDVHGLSAQHPVEQQLRRIFPEVGPFDGQRPGEAVTLAHALEKVTLGLQAHAGCPVSFSRTTPTEEPGVFQVVIQYTEEAVGRLALKLADALCQAAIQGIGFDLEGAIAQLHELELHHLAGLQRAPAHELPARAEGDDVAVRGGKAVERFIERGVDVVDEFLHGWRLRVRFMDCPRVPSQGIADGADDQRHRA